MSLIDRLKIQFAKMEVMKMFEAIKLPLQKYGPAVVAALSVLLAAVGFVYGPLDIPLGLGGAIVHVPAVDIKTLMGVLWPLAVAVLHHVHLKGQGGNQPASLPPSK